MADAPQETNKPADLSSLEGLTLGTAWSATPPSSGNAERREFRERRDDRGERPFRRDDSRPRFDRPRREGRPFERKGEGFRREGRPDERGERRFSAAPTPPSIKVVFYPEEAPFKALTKAIKASKRTYELFEIARLILEKPERAVATLANKNDEAGKPLPFYQAVVDGSVFLTEAEALQHAGKLSLEKFFKAEEVEVEAPKGNFVIVHRCGVTGKLIAPPNYHRYAALLAEHQAKNLPQMTVAAIQAKVESVKEPEVITQWVESMKKITRYTLLNTPEGQPATTFDGVDAAIAHLIASVKAELVKPVSQPRLSAKQIEALPKGEIRRSIEVTRTLQLKFPLETANNLRGRLRRMGFNIYKRGQKGVSYLCAVKRKFRIIGQTFAPEVQQVIECLSKNPNISDSELPKQMLGINPPAEPKHTDAHEAECAAPAASAPAASALTAEEESAWKKLKQTLQWLVEEGYVIHFGNGKLFVPPERAANAPKEEGEEEETAEAAASEEVTPEATAETPAEAVSEAAAPTTEENLAAANEESRTTETPAAEATSEAAAEKKDSQP